MLMEKWVKKRKNEKIDKENKVTVELVNNVDV